MRKYLRTFTFLLLALPLSVVAVLALDYFDFRKNYFCFTALDVDKRISDSITIAITDGRNDTVFLNGQIIKNTFQDLYGKESFELKINNNVFNHSFQDYKFCSWHKTNYSVSLTANKDTVFIDWSIKTLWHSHGGRNSIKNWLTNWCEVMRGAF